MPFHQAGGRGTGGRNGRAVRVDGVRCWRWWSVEQASARGAEHWQARWSAKGPDDSSARQATARHDESAVAGGNMDERPGGWVAVPAVLGSAGTA